MKLWELRSYEQVVQLEQARLVYRTRLRATYGRSWRRQAPVELLLPLKLARYGVPLPEIEASVSDETPAEVTAADAVLDGAAEPVPVDDTDTDDAVGAAARAVFAAAVADFAAQLRTATESEQPAADPVSVPVEAQAEPLLISERTDLGFEVPEAPADAFLEWLDDQQQPRAAVEAPEPQVAAESTDPEPDEPPVSKLVAGQEARLERLRQNRQAAADAWWKQLEQGTTPSYGEHARAYGVSVPTLRKAIAEFPEPATEAAP